MREELEMMLSVHMCGLSFPLISIVAYDEVIVSQDKREVNLSHRRAPEQQCQGIV